MLPRAAEMRQRFRDAIEHAHGDGAVVAHDDVRAHFDDDAPRPRHFQARSERSCRFASFGDRFHGAVPGVCRKPTFCQSRAAATRTGRAEVPQGGKDGFRYSRIFSANRTLNIVLIASAPQRNTTRLAGAPVGNVADSEQLPAGQNSGGGCAHSAPESGGSAAHRRQSGHERHHARRRRRRRGACSMASRNRWRISAAGEARLLGRGGPRAQRLDLRSRPSPPGHDPGVRRSRQDRLVGALR